MFVMQIQESLCAQRLGCLPRLFCQVCLEKHDGRAHRDETPGFSRKTAEVPILHQWQTLLQEVNCRFGVGHDDAIRAYL